jgi:hypothetical protein
LTSIPHHTHPLFSAVCAADGKCEVQINSLTVNNPIALFLASVLYLSDSINAMNMALFHFTPILRTIFVFLLAVVVTKISALTTSPLPLSSLSCLGRHSIHANHPQIQHDSPINVYGIIGNRGLLRRSYPLYADTYVNTAVQASVGDNDDHDKTEIDTGDDDDENVLPSDPASTTPEFLAGLWQLIAQGNNMVRGVS